MLKINNKINEISNNLISTSFDDIKIKNKNKKGVILEMKEEKNDKRLKFKRFAMALSLAILLAISVYIKQNKIMATISFDINPSVELKINDKYKVMEAISNNEDGKKVLADMDLKGASLNVATNALIGSMVKLGYITEAKNSILVTVLGSNEKKNQTLQTEVANDINEYLKTTKIDGAIISQVVNETSELERQATIYGITIGKVELINKIIESNPLYSFEALFSLTTNELNLLISSKKSGVSDVKVEGVVSDKDYIGKEKAKAIVLNHSKLKESDITLLEIEMDYEKGLMVYDVEFNYKAYEYDYEVNALTGEVISYITDYEDDDEEKTIETKKEENKVVTNKNFITKEKAKSIAIGHAKVSEYTDYDIELEYKAGVAVYEIDFETLEKEYEYIINATTGSIIKFHSEVE